MSGWALGWGKPVPFSSCTSEALILPNATSMVSVVIRTDPGLTGPEQQPAHQQPC